VACRLPSTGSPGTGPRMSSPTSGSPTAGGRTAPRLGSPQPGRSHSATPPRRPLGPPPAVILAGRDPATIVVSPEDGLLEALLEPGDPVSAGQTVGRLWVVDLPRRAPLDILAPLRGHAVV